MATQKKAKQRFVALRVDEVSLVDDPANEEKFIVVKRKETDQMAGKTNEGDQEVVDTKKTDSGDQPDTQAQTDDNGASDNDNSDEEKSVAKKLEEVQGLLTQLGPVMKTLQEKGLIEKEDEKETEDELPDDATEVEVAKADFRKLKTLVARLQKVAEAFGSQFSVKKEGDEKPTKKAKVVKDEDGNEVVVLDLETAKSMQEKLGSFIEEQEADEPKSDQVAMAEAVGAAISKALEPVTKSMTGLAERIETIETTRGDTNAGSDETTTKKKKSGMWDGNLTGFSSRKQS